MNRWHSLDEWLRYIWRAARIKHRTWSFRTIHGASIDRILSLRMPNSELLPYIYVNPLRVDYKCNLRGAIARETSLIRSGNWDQARIPIEQMVLNDPRYVSCRELVEDRLPIEQTREYAQQMERLQRYGEARGGRKSEAAVRAYLQSIQALYEQIIADGRLRTQRELGNVPHEGEINCAIGADGTLLKTDNGNHRFAIARLLKFERIPIQVSVIHARQLGVIQNIMRQSGVDNAIDAIDAINLYLQDVQQRYIGLEAEAMVDAPADNATDERAVPLEQARATGD